MTEAEVEALGTGGWFVREGFAPAAAAAVQVRLPTTEWGDAGVSHAGRHDPAIRGDQSAWLVAGDLLYTSLFAGFEALRVEMNSEAWLGLGRFEVQLARFPASGAGYVRHRDALAGPLNRRLTAISYLNPLWKPADGGLLRLWVTPRVDLAPLLGRLVVFRSALIEHQVMPVFAPRFAATAWFYGY